MAGCQGYAGRVVEYESRRGIAARRRRLLLDERGAPFRRHGYVRSAAGPAGRQGHGRRGKSEGLVRPVSRRYEEQRDRDEPLGGEPADVRRGTELRIRARADEVGNEERWKKL